MYEISDLEKFITWTIILLLFQTSGMYETYVSVICQLELAM